SLSDVWEMFTLVAAQRKRREVDPILNTLRRCREELSPEAIGSAADEPAARERARRINDLYSFLATMDGLAQRFFESHRGLRAGGGAASGAARPAAMTNDGTGRGRRPVPFWEHGIRARRVRCEVGASGQDAGRWGRHSGLPWRSGGPECLPHRLVG